MPGSRIARDSDQQEIQTRRRGERSVRAHNGALRSPRLCDSIVCASGFANPVREPMLWKSSAQTRRPTPPGFICLVCRPRRIAKHASNQNAFDRTAPLAADHAVHSEFAAIHWSFRYCNKSAICWTVTSFSIPSGISETLLILISSISARPMVCCFPSGIVNTTVSAVSEAISP